MWDLCSHVLPVREGIHTVIRSPEDSCRHGDTWQDRPQIFCRGVDQGLSHHGTCLLIVMHANEFVEQLFPHWSEYVQSRNRQEKFSGFRQCESYDSLDMSGVTNAGGGTEKKAVNRKCRSGVFRIARSGGKLDSDPTSVRMPEQPKSPIICLWSVPTDPVDDPVGVVVRCPGHLRIRLLAESRKIGRKDSD